MISKTQKEIQATLNKLAALEKKAAAEELSKIENLHKDAGFATREDLIAALQALGGAAAPRGRKAAKAAKAAKTPEAPEAPKAKKAAKVAKVAKVKVEKGTKERAKRTVITAELRQGIIDALESGGKGNAVAAKFGVSVPTLHNIKKAAGLTKARK